MLCSVERVDSVGREGQAGQCGAVCGGVEQCGEHGVLFLIIISDSFSHASPGYRLHLWFRSRNFSSIYISRYFVSLNGKSWYVIILYIDQILHYIVIRTFATVSRV